MSDDLLAILPTTIAAAIKLGFPELRECKGISGRFDLARLAKDTVKAPAVLVSQLGAKQGKTLYGNLPTFDLSMAAFIITNDRKGLHRDTAAANIAQALLKLIPENHWGLEDLGQARDVREQSLVTAKTRGAAASLRAITWVQPATFTLVPVLEPVAIELYFGQSPNIGPGHEGDYEQIGGQT